VAQKIYVDQWNRGPRNKPTQLHLVFNKASKTYIGKKIVSLTVRATKIWYSYVTEWNYIHSSYSVQKSTQNG
jgi:hypothetical protein